ncbi:CDP-glucose 4,6-dehydratase [[Leptolyngbya] sp. PCC 7376]|uniref:CDP-glucose 4,6-dehydratase n=1 Tax=[Leptolyngbya] sp. PCC 7376 TaxID=111781 RepID=UPI00029EF620|nr:CDP-glucose 4,6-dehydratase [[Leptolyngbya] sp. PCC 7376]AFY36961.1 CDP-glucose 4,6-dehydratase [[Leptolyngbya] sp. PCC 7376]
MQSSFWESKKVLVTGHTGFKGSWLSLLLSHWGADVIGYALKPPSEPSLFYSVQLDELVNSIEGDVRNYDYLKKIIQEHKPDVIFHMAAQSLVLPSYQDPITTYSTNVMGTVNLLEAVRKVGTVKVVVNVTSDKCYKNKEWFWGYRENEEMGGYDPYSNSKGCAELITSAFRDSFFYQSDSVALASVRAGNVIGGGDWATNRLVPDIVRALVQNEVVTIRSPNAIRPWQHVLEPISGYITLAEKMWSDSQKFSQGWNFGPNDNDVKPVKWITQYLTNAWPTKGAWKLDEEAQLHEANYLKLDCSKARKILQWKPVMNLEQSLEWIISWYSLYYQREDVREITLEQIQQYCQLVSNA